jgi:hypothetical protein
MVRNCEVVSASLVAEGASEPALADAGGDYVVPGSSRQRRVLERARGRGRG